MIMQAADIPYEGEQISSLMAVVLTIDWFMDRCRTSINVLGDSVVAAVVDKKIYGLDPAVASESDATAGAGPLRDTVELERFTKQTSSQKPLDESCESQSESRAGETLVNGLPLSVKP